MLATAAADRPYRNLRAGQRITCTRCHGTYGDDDATEGYPNLLVPLETIGTDSLLASTYDANPQYHSWYNESWFAQGEGAAQLLPNDGYVAPPLDGIWATAPYLHNGSVPTLADLLQSTARPTYFARDLSNANYDESKLGWRYEAKADATSTSTYNTTLPGYGNGGHTFGDELGAADRAALLEYLKTL